MPKTVVSVKFNPSNGTGYLRDINDEIFTSGRFILPPDIPSTNIAAIVTAVGGELSDVNAPCPDNLGGELRRLVFIRASGNSMSVPVSSRADLISAATTIRGILATTGNAVVCIKLMGEYFPILNDELGVNYQGTFAQTHKPPGTAPKQYYYSGAISYEADGTNPSGGTVFVPVKSISNNETLPATKFGTVWATCVGNFVNILSCGGAGRVREHRRFLLTTQTKLDPAQALEAPQSEVNELPCKDYAGADILACGQAAAALAGVYCIGYRGESYARFHKLLP
jgi:hypothetical protein